MTHPLTWMVEVAILLLLARMSEALLSRLDLPKVMGYVIIGLAIPLLNYELAPITEALGILGIVTYLFYIGLEGSLRGFLRGFKAAGIVAIGGVFSSVALPLIILPLLGLSLSEAFAVGAALSATSVTLTVRAMEDLGRGGSREGQTIISAAVVDDVLGLTLLSTIAGIAEGGFSLLSLLEISALAIGLWFAVSFTFKEVSRPVFKLASMMKFDAPFISVTFILLLIISFIAAYMRLSTILLAYALGLGISSHRYIAKRISWEINTLIALFTPLFFISAGAVVNLREITTSQLGEFGIIIATIIILGFATKIIGCVIPAKIVGFSIKEALVIGVGMIPRAEVMLTAALSGKEFGLLGFGTYTGLILLVPITTITVPPLLALIYRK